jgi:N-acetylglucosaminyl-diphospho-decaprenol L-rhamnosyltransferase
MRAAVVIPTWNARDPLANALASLEAQTVPVQIIVVDNASKDGTTEMLAECFPQIAVVRNTENIGFGRAINRGAQEATDADVLVLINNDAVCERDFVQHLLEPFADAHVGMVAGVLLQGSAPDLIDSAGIELDSTLRSYDLLWNEPVTSLPAETDPIGPCGGAAAYRMSAFREVGGFDPALFAYWEDVDLALRLRDAGWLCSGAPGARALHHHGQTLGAGSPKMRALDAFGRGFILGRYQAANRRLSRRAEIALLDWPALLAHLIVRREAAPIRERRRGMREGRSRPPLRAPVELATVNIREAIARQWRFLALRLTGRAPSHFSETEGSAAPS